MAPKAAKAPKATPKATSAKKGKPTFTKALKLARKAKRDAFAAFKAGKVKKPVVKRQKVVPPAVKKLIVHDRTKPLWIRIKKLAAKKGVQPQELLKKKPKTVEKKVGGAGNGGTRRVLVKKTPKFYPTETRPKSRKTGRVTHKTHPRKFKKGLEPGRVLIIVAGKHRGKRVVLLKTLASGLLLVNGPFKINACPMRRMHQNFVIVTRTKIPFDSVKVPGHINDKYFKSKKVIKAGKGKKSKQGGNIFARKKTIQFKPNRARSEDQAFMDQQIIKAIREKVTDKKTMFAYLGSFFYLRNHMYPHKLKY
ncbi:60S ribosomal protein L6, partial [Fragariocoptes setiger]